MYPQNYSLMEIGALTRVFLVAGLTLALIGGLGFAIIDLYAWEENKNMAYAPFSAYATPLRSLVTCGVFGAFQAIVAVGGIVVVCLWWMLLPIVTVIVGAVSALLFLGELVPAAIFISAFSTGDPYVPRSKMNYLEDPEFEKYVENYLDIQSQYSCKDNEEWGSECTAAPSNLLAFGNWYRFSEMRTLRTSYSWNSTTMSWDEVRFSGDSGEHNGILPCIIDYNTSKDITYYGLYDCERLDLVVVECIGGWSEGKLNSWAKKKCREENNDQFKTWDENKLTSWEKTIKNERDTKVGNVKASASDLWSCRFLNIVLLVLELFSCILTVVGIVTAFFYSGQSRSAWRESSSTSSEAVTASLNEEENNQPPPPQMYQPPPQGTYEPAPVPPPPPVERPDQPQEESGRHESSSVSESVSSKSSSETS